MKTLLKLILLVFLGLGGVVVGRALLLVSEEDVVVTPVQVQVDPGAVARFAASVRIPTISHGDPDRFDPAPFEAFNAYLREVFPKVHDALELEVVGGHSLLYTWAGRNQRLPPVILMAHSDVVPVEPGTEGSWSHPPFSGAVDGGYVWGRGAMDDKASLMGILEGAEALLSRGFEPERTLLFSFGHDEEVGGLMGARAIASLLADRGVMAAYVLDEGMAIAEGSLPGVEGPVALLGLAEKGSVSLLLSVEVAGGHSSTPPRETAVGILARALARLEDHPMPPRLEGPSRMLLETLAPAMPFSMRLVMGNLWLFRGAVVRIMAGTPETDASIRTTTAPTLLRAGVKENVLPSQSQAVVNFRILPGDSSQDVIAHVEETVGDPRVRVEVYQGTSTEPSPVSRMESFGYGELRATVHEIFPGTRVAPFLALGGTDSKHFTGVAEDVYRFAPLRYRPEIAGGYHGTNERIPVGDYLDMVRFYTRLLERSGG
jgi:carboxypeptidase PM20D1